MSTADELPVSGRSALLEATIRVTARDGLRGVTYRSVAAEAGFTHGLVAHHFGTRDALLSEALAYALTRNLEQSRLTSDEPGFAGLAAGLARFVRQDPGLQAFQYELLLESRRKPELAPLVRRLYEGYQEAIRAELRLNEIEDPALAHLITSAIDGVVLRQISGATPGQTEDALDALRRLLHAYTASGASSRSAGAD